VKQRKSSAWRWGAASLAIALGHTGAAAAQEAAADMPITTAEDIVVQADIEYRNRVEGPAPVLEYGLDYFQRFEPRTVGDMLKRTPSAAFAGSDMGEFDDLQIRGLGAGYTQILIDGERVPGSGEDRTFFVDRIPAELVERVEIVRSQSANRSGDAVAGALNIVLRDAMTLDGGYIRAGALHYNDNETEGTLAGVWGGSLGGNTRLLLGASYQGRHNPKEKFSQRFTTPPGGTHWDGDPPFELQNTEAQDDVRDGEDYTLNASLFIPVGEGELELSGVYVRTDREEIEDSFEFDDGGDLETIVPGYAYIQQDNINLQADFEHPFLGGQLEIDLGYAIFDETSLEGETETGIDGGGLIESFEGEEENFDFTDEELSFSIAQQFDLNDNFQLEVGVDWNQKERDGLVTNREFEFEDNGPPIGDAPPFTGDPWTEADETDDGVNDGGDFLIEERRLDPFVMVTGENGAIEWEAGLRYETTELDVTDRDEAVTTSHEYETLLPSAHLRFNVTEDDRLNFSVARSVRRPSFRFIMPSLFEGEFGDNDFQGNPLLDPETAWGVDLGWEHRLGRVGVVGINVFYRDVTDVLEIFNTGELTEEYEEALEEFLDDNPGSTEEDFFDEEPPVFIYSARNTGDGQVWGVEFDLSTPLTFVGLENTGVFLNYSWLDSEIQDEFGTRRFNNQSEFVLNVGFIHDMPTLGAAFGATYRQQGDAFTRVLGEEVNISYGGDLEVFVEKRFGENFSLRFTGSNLLDASKDEVYDVFLNADHQADRLHDEYELETESTGPVYQLVARYAF
jgi:outer membrane receptor protein involved in Fe transport